MKKICEICGKSYDAYKKDQKTCSEFCRNVKKSRLSTEIYRRKKEGTFVSKMHTKCDICGEVIQQPVKGGTKFSHNECLLNELADFYEKNGHLTTIKRRILYSRGFKMDDLRKIIESRNETVEIDKNRLIPKRYDIWRHASGVEYQVFEVKQRSGERNITVICYEYGKYDFIPHYFDLMEFMDKVDKDYHLDTEQEYLFEFVREDTDV